MITRRFLKIAGVIILVFVAVAITIIIVLPSSAYMERSIHVNASPEIVYRELISFRNFTKISPWAVNNPDAKYVVFGPESGIGAGISWEGGSEDFQSGSIEIVDVLENQYVISKMGFEGYESNPQSKWLINRTDSGAWVTWAFEEKEIRGFNKVFMLGIDGFLGDVYEQGLSLLKERSETAPESIYQICIVQVNSKPYLGISDFSINDRKLLSDRMKDNFDLLYNHIDKYNIQVTGPPFTMYTAFSDKELEFINGVPITTDIYIDHELIKMSESYNGRAVSGSYSGDYEYVMDVFRDIESYIYYYGYERTGNIWEEYEENILLQSDSAHWEVQVFYPVK